ncbi:MAG TPA: glycosyltransferase family 39 protein, partial [Acidimicrobiales bacterium]|nr:glycosyltransferase family 39 protein [Acidimicrobiales bacterium]
MTRRGVAVARWWSGVPAVAAMAAVVAATGKGVYVSPDAVSYVGTARNLVAGRGLTPPAGLPPVGHFPPLFPLVLAAVARLGCDPLTAARVVNVAAVGGVVLLVGLLVGRLTGSGVAALAASVAAAASVDLLAASGSALSEPLFLLLAVAALGALGTHLDAVRRQPGGPARSYGWLAAASVLAAGALLTRYVGAALVVAGVAALLRFGRRRRWHGAVEAAVFGVVATAPAVGFLAWAGRAKGADDRSFAWHAFGLDYLGQAARPVTRWILAWPGPPLGLLLAIAVVVGVGVAVVVGGPPARRGSPASSAASASSASSATPWLLGCFGVAYLVVVVANRLVTDATGRLDARFLAPLHVVVIVLAAVWLHRHRTVAPVVALAGAVVVAQVAGAVAWTAGGLSDGGLSRRGYTAAAWRTSPVLARLKAAAGPVYSNAFDGIEFSTGRGANPLPAKVEYLTGR